MSESWLSDTPIGEWYQRTRPNRIFFAGAMLRFAGLLGASYCAILIAALAYSWLVWHLGLVGAGQISELGPDVTGYGLRLVAFLLAYAVGAVLPVLIKPERSNAGKE